jgi:hypothetical protein
MDKIMSVRITAFLIASSMVVVFSMISANQVFAVEYNTYTSKNFGIEFQYPSNFEIDEDDETEDIIISSKQSDHSIGILAPGDYQADDNLENFTEKVFKGYKDVSYISIIQKPIMISTGNLEMQTFLCTEQGDGEIFALQIWTFLGDKRGYAIAAGAPVNTFNSPEHIQFIDHFIKSIKIVNDDKK